MKLTGYLGKDLEDLGLYLEEDEAFVYLKQGEQILDIFLASTLTLARIRKAAREWAKRRNEGK